MVHFYNLCGTRKEEMYRIVLFYSLLRLTVRRGNVEKVEENPFVKVDRLHEKDAERDPTTTVLYVQQIHPINMQHQVDASSITYYNNSPSIRSKLYNFILFFLFLVSNLICVLSIKTKCKSFCKHYTAFKFVVLNS